MIIITAYHCWQIVAIHSSLNDYNSKSTGNDYNLNPMNMQSNALDSSLQLCVWWLWSFEIWVYKSDLNRMDSDTVAQCVSVHSTFVEATDILYLLTLQENSSYETETHPLLQISGLRTWFLESIWACQVKILVLMFTFPTTLSAFKSKIQ